MVNGIFGALMSGTSGQLSVFNTNRDVSTQQLTNQLTADFQQRVNDKVTSIQQSYTSETNSIQREEDRILSYRKDLDASRDVITNTRTRLEGILSRLDNMIINVNKANESENDPDIQFLPASYAAAHDSSLRQIDDLIKTTRTQENLLVSESQSVRYPVSLSGITSLFYGTDLTTGYHIEDMNGDFWYPNLDNQVIKTYESYPFTEGDVSVSTVYNQGLTLDNLSGNNVDFTVGADTASPQSYSGTLGRSGLEVLQSWLYEGFSDSANRERALEDINAAKEVINVELSRYNMIETTLNYYDELSTNNLRSARRDKIEVEAEAAHAIAEKQSEMVQQFQSVQSVLAQQLVLRTQYQSLIPTSSFGQALFSAQV
jgi:hypothetical protein